MPRVYISDRRQAPCYRLNPPNLRRDLDQLVPRPPLLRQLQYWLRLNP